MDRACRGLSGVKRFLGTFPILQHSLVLPVLRFLLCWPQVDDLLLSSSTLLMNLANNQSRFELRCPMPGQATFTNGVRALPSLLDLCTTLISLRTPHR
jgi:hypothetical protein